jgi:hypothetical protein
MTLTDMVEGIDAGAIERDARERLEWCATQSADPADWSALLPQSGDGAPVEMIPAPATVREERYRAITRQRMGRMLGQRKGNRWAGRETGSGPGPFNPADITDEQAAALLVIVGRYVAAHAGPGSLYPLSPDRQEDTVSRIVHAIWTRDYARSNVMRGNLAGATWQACALYRKTAWIGEGVFDKKDAKRDRPEDIDRTDIRTPPCDDPARIAAAVEQAESGLWAPSAVNRGRKQARRQRGGKRMDAVAPAVAREALTGAGG